MTKEAVLSILKEEKLYHYNWNEEHDKRENEAAIKFEKNNFIVYVTDERAAIVTNSITSFSSEEDALDNFIKRVRTEKILFK